MSPRLRFAPSPTGSPHIGSLHTALFSWGLARALGGTFLIRIDDTDAARNRPNAAALMLDALAWLGLDWDEGPDIGGPHAPYVQSQRRPRHLEAAAQLVAQGAAYYDADSGAGAQDPSAPDSAPVLRLRLPRHAPLVVNDALRGPVVFDPRHFADPIVVRSDGAPLYHLANAIDDHDMGITHVVRGDDWLSSAPIQQTIYRALGWDEPVWVHLPLIVNRQGQKLSKRDPDGGYLAHDFQQAGYLPQALFNYLLLLGWSPADGQQLLSWAQARPHFQISRLSSSPASFDWERLNWFNQQYLQRLGGAALARLARPYLEEAYGDLPPESWVQQLVVTLRDDLVRLSDVVKLSRWAFEAPADYSEAARAAWRSRPARAVLARALVEVASVVVLDTITARDRLAYLTQTWGRENGWRTGEVLLPLRAALTGRHQGPPLAEIMGLLGRQRCLERLATALRQLDGDSQLSSESGEA